MQLTPEQYLRAGTSSAWHVPDLVPTEPAQIRLLFVLESPHVDELDVGRPVVGGAGKSALRFLQGVNWAGASLGEFVVGKHALRDGRLAVMNVSTIPLQREAFARTAATPDLSPQEWKWLGVTFRNSRARTVDATGVPPADAIGGMLLDGLQERVDQLGLDAACTIVACGRFAQRYVRQLNGLPRKPLAVPHPANNQWHPKQEQVPHGLMRAQQLFADNTR
ncbi:hypothetical protein JNB63_11825 [Microbacterium trichothecenolyticum]|uniref:hypothetical protein n=1 Tax=Microbacterium trichothecenolyticum TaxID=69370 RepID=UPI001C6F44B6|nr:hypothetical protein [Microbacterium trichothecenolyticum]MBW9120783.1 hypothetical protein [Microbacterium trichothecenolyticum]